MLGNDVGMVRFNPFHDLEWYDPAWRAVAGGGGLYPVTQERIAPFGLSRIRFMR